MTPPLIVGIGGSTREESASERVMQMCLAEAQQRGARTLAFNGAALRMPLYDADPEHRTAEAAALVAAIRACDGIVLVSPGYHGGISGFVKNALDYVEDLRDDERPYLDGRAVGCVACAAGWQAAGMTLQALRAVVHALRGWPTPLGVIVNTELPVWGDDGTLDSPPVRLQIGILVEQVLEFARRWAGPG